MNIVSLEKSGMFNKSMKTKILTAAEIILCYAKIIHIVKVFKYIFIEHAVLLLSPPVEPVPMHIGITHLCFLNFIEQVRKSIKSES